MIMTDQPVCSDDLDDQEWAEFQRDYNRWCLEVELAQIEKLNKTVDQNS
jgi:hypothetical protein